MGHREDVWENETFLKMTADALRWANGEGELRGEPNYHKTVGKTE
jgi:hypothetical protein